MVGTAFVVAHGAPTAADPGWGLAVRAEVTAPAIYVDSGHRTVGGRRGGAQRRHGRRCLRQRPRRVRNRPVQDRGDPATGTLARPRPGRTRRPGMGRLAQPPPAAHRLLRPTTSRVRADLLRSTPSPTTGWSLNNLSLRTRRGGSHLCVSSRGEREVSVRLKAAVGRFAASAALRRNGTKFAWLSPIGRLLDDLGRARIP